MSDAAKLLTVQFLGWVASRSRTYGDVKQAWRSTCPRLSIWEDAIDADLIRLESGGDRVMDQSKVALTPRGRAMLEGDGQE
jgi:hypothetical protein